MLGKWFPQQKINDFKKGLELLRDYKQNHNVNSPESAIQALKDLNVPTDFLSKTGGLANNPVVSSVAQMFNVNTDKIQQDVQTLMGSRSTTPKDSLESLRNGLNTLNRRK